MVSVALRTILAVAASAILLLPGEARAEPALQTGSVSSPAWSPDGHSIAWSELIPHVGREIWVARRDMSGAHRVTRPIDALGQIGWLPKHRLVYEANFRLSTVDVGTRKSTLISAVAGESFAVDRRGDRIATGDPPCPTGCNGPVLVFGTHGRLLAKVGGRAQNMSPSFSPNGRRIAFDRTLCTKGGRCDPAVGIWTASVGTGRLQRITRSGVCADWSPDGRSIVYVDGLPAQLRIAPLRGGAATTLSPTSTCNLAFPPTWSPNSRDIANIGTNGGLDIIDVRTRNVRLNTGLSIGFVTGFAWSPDSSQLLVVGQHGPAACADLWLVTVRTAAARPLRRCR